MRALKSILFPIHPEGYRFIAIFAVAAFLLFFLAEFLGWVGVVLTLWCAWFFRDPARVTPQREGLVISPADGVVNMMMMGATPAVDSPVVLIELMYIDPAQFSQPSSESDAASMS